MTEEKVLSYKCQNCMREMRYVIIDCDDFNEMHIYPCKHCLNKALVSGLKHAVRLLDDIIEED